MTKLLVQLPGAPQVIDGGAWVLDENFTMKRDVIRGERSVNVRPR